MILARLRKGLEIVQRIERPRDREASEAARQRLREAMLPKHTVKAEDVKKLKTLVERANRARLRRPKGERRKMRPRSK